MPATKPFARDGFIPGNVNHIGAGIKLGGIDWIVTRDRHKNGTSTRGLRFCKLAYIEDQRHFAVTKNRCPGHTLDLLIICLWIFDNDLMLANQFINNQRRPLAF